MLNHQTWTITKTTIDRHKDSSDILYFWQCTSLISSDLSQFELKHSILQFVKMNASKVYGAYLFTKIGAH